MEQNDSPLENGVIKTTESGKPLLALHKSLNRFLENAASTRISFGGPNLASVKVRLVLEQLGSEKLPPTADELRKMPCKALLPRLGAQCIAQVAAVVLLGDKQST